MNNEKKTSLSPWVRCLRPQQNARIRLFCFPYAGGGSAIFHPIADYLPSEIEVWPVRLPGRDARFSEQAFTNIEKLVPPLAEALLPYLDMPYAFFGHSMGALISFELARTLHQREDVLQPLQLAVSAHRAPHLPDPRPPIHQLPADQFLAELRRFNGTPEEVLQHSELMELLYPLLRADFELCETYVYTAQPLLAIPIIAFGGLQDQSVSREAIMAWCEQTSSTFQASFFPGGHFFMKYEQAALSTFLAHRLLALISQSL